MRRFALLTTAAAVCGLGGCATQGPPPSEELTKARTLIQQAEKSQAQRYAAPDLQRAHDELNSAELANTKGDYNAARGYAESAAVDADVAAARSSAGEALRAAHEAEQGNNALRRETERAVHGSSTPSTPSSDLQNYPQAAPAPAAPPPPETSPPEPQTNPQ